MLNCHDDVLLFLYKQILLASETRPKSVKLPRHPEAGRLLASAGITVLSTDNKLEMEQKLTEIGGSRNTLVLRTDRKAQMESLFRHLRNSVAHAHYRCNRRAGGSIELFHEYRGRKNLFGSVQHQALRQLLSAVEKN